MKNYFIDSNGKHVCRNDHVHHVSRTQLSKYDNRRGLVLQVFQDEATVWFYDTRVSETTKLVDLTRAIY
jgi:hypothetical protein